MLARTACRTRASGSCLSSVASNASTDGRTRSTIERRFRDWSIRRPLKFLQGGQNSPALGMPQNHHQPCAEPRRGELDAADLRRSDDVSGNADDKQVAKALIEDDLCRHPRVGTSENDGERLLTCRQLVAARLARERVAAPNVRDEATVPLSQAFECFSR